jgi:hypothetical protein
MQSLPTSADLERIAEFVRENHGTADSADAGRDGRQSADDG